MKKNSKIVSWVCSVFLILAGLIYIPSVASILLILEGIALLPISVINGLWNKLLKDKLKWIRGATVAVAFILTCMIVPLDDTSTQQQPVTAVETKETETQKNLESETVETEEAGTELNNENANVETETENEKVVVAETSSNTQQFSISSVPAYSSTAFVVVNDNVPYFNDSELVSTAFENYSNLDSLGRCGVAYANVCREIMPTEDRGSIGSVKPTGWHTVKYDIVDGKYLFNRCHLIGYQLSAENANNKNLITGTKYLNVEGMLPFENMVADYVKETNNHVLYRVTPIFEGNNLVASGVLMEAKSVEDNGKGILYNVYCYNVQPGVSIDYVTGESSLDGTAASNEDSVTSNNSSNASVTSAPKESNVDTNTDSIKSKETAEEPAPQPVQEVSPTPTGETVHVTKTGEKYHRAGCKHLKKSDREISLEQAKAQGYKPCSDCNPPQ